MKSSSPETMSDGGYRIPAAKVKLTGCDISFRHEGDPGEVRTLVKVTNRNVRCARMVQVRV